MSHAELDTQVQIKRFDPRADTERLQICHHILELGRSVDDRSMPPKSYDAFARRWTHGSDGNSRQTWLAADEAGTPVGCYRLILPELASSAAVCQLVVTPARRRSGGGAALLEHCVQRARLAGRSRLASNVRDDSPGAAFAAAIGASGGIQTVSRTLDIDTPLVARLASLRSGASQLAAGYELLAWAGATPRGHLGRLALVHDAMADAPRDHGQEHQGWDADRIARIERSQLERGARLYAVAARHRATGELAGLTRAFTDQGIPGWAFQQMTAVRPGHRGHRLGLLVKIEMIELLIRHEPDVLRVHTWNAGVNNYMVAINEQLGYLISGTHRYWGLDLS